MEISDITKETLIGDVVQYFPQAMPAFQAIGMHCMGCAMASGENIEQACAVHWVDADQFLEDLKAYLESL